MRTPPGRKPFRTCLLAAAFLIGPLPPAAPTPPVVPPPAAVQPAEAPLVISPPLRRYPYLTDVVGAAAIVNWATDQSAAVGSVKWGQVLDGICSPTHAVAAHPTALTVNGVNAWQWQATLTLTPATQYCYRVYLGSVDLVGTNGTPRFRTQLPPDSSQAFSFAVFGDWGQVDSQGSNPDQARLLSQLAASGARFALTVGDNSYPAGTQSNYGDLVARGPDLSGVFGPAFWPVAGFKIPLFPALGNHGFAQPDPTHPQLLNWPQARAVAASHGRYARETYCCRNSTVARAYPSAWYAFNAGSARFYVLEAAWDDGNRGTASSYANDYAYHWTPSSAEYQWRAHDLASHPRALKFAFFHYPIYSDNATEASDTFLQGPNSLEGLLGRYGVSLAFSGHAHTYQRNRPPNAQSVITYITAGGGAPLEPIAGHGCSAIDAYGIGWSYSANGGRGAGSACGSAPVPTSVTQVFHFLLVRVNGRQVTVHPTDELGRTFDVQTYHFGSGN